MSSTFINKSMCTLTCSLATVSTYSGCSSLPPPSDVMRQPVVIDSGSAVCKAGFAGEDRPRVVFPAVVGFPKASTKRVFGGGADDEDVHVGDAAQRMRGRLVLKHPIHHGVVCDWHNMERIWHHTFYNELRVDPEEHPVLLTEPHLNPKANREATVKVMFEAFGVPALYLATQAVLTLHAFGHATGVLVDVGEGVSCAVPVYEGYVLTHAVARADLGGGDLTDRLARLLTERGHYFSGAQEREIVRDIKEHLCYVACVGPEEDEDYPDSEASVLGKEPYQEKTYELPDGNLVTIASERSRCPEALFQPSCVGKPTVPGVHELVFDAVQKCDAEIQPTLYASVVLSGGTTLLAGFGERLGRELLRLRAHKRLRPTPIRVIADELREYAAWIGGSLQGSRNADFNRWISAGEYYECGPRIINLKCF